MQKNKYELKFMKLFLEMNFKIYVLSLYNKIKRDWCFHAIQKQTYSNSIINPYPSEKIWWPQQNIMLLLSQHWFLTKKTHKFLMRLLEMKHTTNQILDIIMKVYTSISSAIHLYWLSSSFLEKFALNAYTSSYEAKAIFAFDSQPTDF